MTVKPIIPITSDEAAREVTVTGWVSREGVFYGKDERIARWAGCTHVLCECGALVEKSFVLCPPCCEKAVAAQWAAMPLVDWDGETPFCLHDSDRYFFSADEFYDWLADHALDGEHGPLTATEVRLVLCEPQPFRQVDADFWCDELPEDGELPDAIQAAVDALNAAIEAHAEPASWIPGKRRIVMPSEAAP